MGQQTSGKPLTINAYLQILRIKGRSYLQLVSGKTRIYLGCLNPGDPTTLLDVTIKGLDRLTVDQIKALQRADKSMREGKPKPGPRPKRPPLFGSRL
jgi:hypothetical protein